MNNYKNDKGNWDINKVEPEVLRLKGQGLTTEKALKEVGISLGGYYTALKRKRDASKKQKRKITKKAGPQLVSLPVPEHSPGKLVVLMGSAQDVNQALGLLARF